MPRWFYYEIMSHYLFSSLAAKPNCLSERLGAAGELRWYIYFFGAYWKWKTDLICAFKLESRRMTSGYHQEKLKSISLGEKNWSPWALSFPSLLFFFFLLSLLLYMLSGCTGRTTPEFVHHIHHWICSFLLCPYNSSCHSSWIQVTDEVLKRV